MLGTDSVLAQIGRLKVGQNAESAAQMGLVENTAAAVEAQLSRTQLDGRWLQVAVHDQGVLVHPATGMVVPAPPTVILRQGLRPLALLIGELLVISRTAPRCVRTPLIREARARVLDFQEVDEARLWRLMPKDGAEPAAA